MQKCLDELHAPLEQQVDFQCKYTPPAAADALAAALPLWEEAAEAMKAYRYAERRKEDDADRFAAAQERCAAAAEAMLRVAGDVAAFEGVAFVDIVGVRGGGGRARAARAAAARAAAARAAGRSNGRRSADYSFKV